MQYSISDLEKLSGIQSHTIRIWEQRYKALVPHRSIGNTRYYDDEHVKRLLNIVSLHQTGLKISQICQLPDSDMKQLIQQDIEDISHLNMEFEIIIVQLIKHGLAYDETAFNELLNRCIKPYGVKTCYQEIIYPLLVRVGLMWQGSMLCPAQEHFISNLVRQKIFAEINVLPPFKKDSSTWLLFLPEDEGHDIGLLFANYTLRNAGKKVIYLGSHVPLPSLEDAMQANQIDYLLLFMTHTRLVNDVQNYIDHLAKTFSTIKIYIAGSNKLIDELNLPLQVNWLKSLNDLEQLIHPNKK